VRCVVDGTGQGNRGVRIVQAVDSVQAVQDRHVDLRRVKGLLLKELEIGAGWGFVRA
jgi:hypothetical protein